MPKKYNKAGKGSALDKIHSALTDRLVDLLDQGIPPWRKTWHAPASRSVSTQKEYRGINAMILDATAAVKGYESPYWLTFRQAEKHGGTVSKGEKGTPIAFWKFPSKDDNEKRVAEGKEPMRAPLMRFYHVWNVAQCEGLNLAFDAYPKRHIDTVQAEENAKQTLTDAQARICPMVPGAGAFYNFSKDHVIMPPKSQFEAAECYYQVAFHEYVHATGHSSRLNRLDVTEGTREERMARESYAREELIAEIGSVALAAKVGLDVSKIERLSAAYIKGWAERIKEDPSILITAAQQAQKATDLVLGIDMSRELKGEDQPENDAPESAITVSLAQLATVASYRLDAERTHAVQNEITDERHPARMKERLLEIAAANEGKDTVVLEGGSVRDLKDLVLHHLRAEKSHFEETHPAGYDNTFGRDAGMIDSWLSKTSQPFTDREWDGQTLKVYAGGVKANPTPELYSRDNLVRSGVLVPNGPLIEQCRRFELQHVYPVIRDLALSSGLEKELGREEEMLHAPRLPVPHGAKVTLPESLPDDIDLSVRNLGCILVNHGLGRIGEEDHAGVEVRRFAVRRGAPATVLESAYFKQESAALNYYLQLDATLESLQVEPGRDVVERDHHFSPTADLSANGTFMGAIVRKGIKADLYMKDEGDGAKTPVAHLESGGAKAPIALNLRSHDTENPFVAVSRKLALEQGLSVVSTNSEVEIS